MMRLVVQKFQEELVREFHIVHDVQNSENFKLKQVPDPRMILACSTHT